MDVLFISCLQNKLSKQLIFFGKKQIKQINKFFHHLSLFQYIQRCFLKQIFDKPICSQFIQIAILVLINLHQCISPFLYIYSQLEELQTYCEHMRNIDIKVSVDYLKLKVKFACKITLSLKFKNQQYSLVEEQPLVDGTLNVPSKEVNSLQAEYSSKDEKFTQNQSLTLVLYLHSSHGKLLIGSFQYKLNEVGSKKSFVEKIKNSPDKAAEIKFTIELTKNAIIKKQDSKKEENKKQSSKNQYAFKAQRKYTSSSYKDNKDTLVNTSPTPAFNSIINSTPASSTTNMKTSSVTKFQDRNNSPKFLMKSNAYSPTNYSKVNLAESNLRGSGIPRYDEGRGNVESLKRKLSEIKQVNTQGNQKFVERIMQLQKQVKINKQKISHYQLDLKLKENNVKFVEKDLANKKQKNQAQQVQIKELNKRILVYEQKIRQLQYSLKQVIEQHGELLHSNELMLKKGDKKQQYYKDQASVLSQKYYELEKDKEKLLYKISSLQTQNEETIKKLQEQMKEKDKKTNQQKIILNKRIAQLQKQIGEIKSQSISQLQKNKLLVRQLQDLKNSNQKLSNQLNKTKDKVEELLLVNRKFQMEKQALEQELKEEKMISAQIKGLKKIIQDKTEEIDIKERKMARMQEEMSDQQQKIKQLTIHSQQLEQEYEKLYYQSMGDTDDIERKKKTIADLIDENEQMEKTIERLNVSVRNLQYQHDEQVFDLKENIKKITVEQQKMSITYKQTKDQLLQEKERRKISEKQLIDAKKQNQENAAQIQTLEAESINLNTQINQLKGSIMLLENRNQNLTNQIEELRRIKNQKQTKYLNLSEEVELSFKQKDDQIDSLHGSIDKLSLDIKDLHQALEEMVKQMDSKDVQIVQLRQQLDFKKLQQHQLNKAKGDLQLNNSQYKDKVIELHQKIQHLQQKLGELDNQMKELDEQLIELNTHSSDSVIGHEERKKKIHDLFVTVELKDKMIEDYQQNISNLQLQVAHLKDQQKHLNEELDGKREQLIQVHKDRDQLNSYIDNHLVELRGKLDQKDNQAFAQSVFKMHEDQSLTDKQNALSKYGQILKSINQQIQKVLLQRQALNKSLQKANRSINEYQIQVGKYKMIEEQLNSDKNQLKQSIEDKKKDLSKENNTSQKLKDQINQLINKNIKNQAAIKDLQFKLDQALALVREKKENIEQLNRQMQKQINVMRDAEQSFLDKEKEYNKKLQMLKHDIAQKSKQLAQTQNQKKNRISILNNNVEQLRKQNYDLQTIAYTQKSNNTKLNSILGQLNTSIAKVQKANNIKTYYMIPIKDLLKKFQQIMQASDKMYADYQKKAKNDKLSLESGIVPPQQPSEIKLTKVTSKNSGQK